jgi:hypothetical protein
VVLGNIFEPAPVRGQKKYSINSGHEMRMLEGINVPVSVRQNMARLGSCGIAKATWSSYRTAERMWLMCKSKKGTNIELPASLESILIFIDFLIVDRGLSGATVSCYLSGLRQLHVMRGMEPSRHLRGDLVKLVLKGKKNEDAIVKRRGAAKRRLAVTENIMLLLKEKIRCWEKPAAEKLLVWAVCTIAFAGAFRIHEILCQLEATFDPDFELLGRDVCIHGEGKSLSFALKCPKENKSAAPVVVDVFANGGALCPIRAFWKWKKNATWRPDRPLFCWPDGTPLTGKRLNGVLKQLLSDVLIYAEGSVTSHSFRSGIASMMAAKGFNEHDIKAIGRWSSRAYEVYIKHPRTKRAEMAGRLW